MCHSTNDLLSASTSKDGTNGITYSTMSTLNEICATSSSVDDDDDDDVSLKIKMRITEKEGDGIIYYKDDEQRFSQQYTVKLKTFTEYNIVLEVRPPRVLTYVKVGSRKYKVFNKLESSVTPGKNIYTFVWSTWKIRTTERKHRSVLPFAVKFHQNQEVNFDVFVKFYYNCEVTHYTGTPLTFIEIKSGKKTDKENQSDKDVIRIK